MEPLAKALESLKTATYEVLAVLLPGLVLLVALKSAGAQPQGSGVVTLVAAYVLGTALQGLSRIAARPWERRVRAKYEAAKVRASTLAKARANTDGKAWSEAGNDEETLLDYCLACIGNERSEYDKFLALRDMTRSLVLAVLAFLAPVITDTSSSTARKWALSFGVLALAFALFLRYLRYAPFPYRAVYVRFIAVPAKEPTERTPAQAPATAREDETSLSERELMEIGEVCLGLRGPTLAKWLEMLRDHDKLIERDREIAARLLAVTRMLKGA